jgi:hypothetical protein
MTAFVDFCSKAHFTSPHLIEAVETTAGENTAAVDLRRCSQILGSDSKTVLKTTANALLQGVDYIVSHGQPRYTLEGILKLSDALQVPTVGRDVSKCLMLHSKWVAERLRLSQEAVTREKRRSDTLKEKLTSKYSPGERVYIMRNSVYGPENLYKVGRTKNLHKRLSTYNTGNPEGDVTVVYEKRCCDSKLVEGIVHHILDAYRYETNREYFNCPVSCIKESIDHAVEATDGYRDILLGRPRAPSETSKGPSETSKRPSETSKGPDPDPTLPLAQPRIMESRWARSASEVMDGDRICSKYFTGTPTLFTG